MPVAPEQSDLRVSAIIPTYNRADYLREALSTVFAQSLEPWEIIVVDDGSTDHTQQVIQDAPGPVRYLRQANRGVAEARNGGLEAARGNLVAWLDSDDLWEPEFLATVVPLLAQDEAIAGAYTGVTMIDADGVELSRSVRVETPEKLYDVLIRNCFLATPSIVVRKACYEQVGRFDPQFRIAEDYDMWLRLSRRYSIVGVPRPLVRIRIHTTNTMADADAYCGARLALARKHFGEYSNDGNGLSDEARTAYGFAFRSIALKYVESGRMDAGWTYLSKSIALCPGLLGDLNTFYEVACGDQTRGTRGQVQGLDLAANSEELLRRLDALFASADAPAQALRSTAYGKAHLALAMLADQAGDWSAARGYLLEAIRFDPGLLRDRNVLRRFAKVMAGQRLTGVAKQIVGRESSSEGFRPHTPPE